MSCHWIFIFIFSTGFFSCARWNSQNFLCCCCFSCQLIRQLSHFIAFFISFFLFKVCNRKISTCQRCFFAGDYTLCKRHSHIHRTNVYSHLCLWLSVISIIRVFVCVCNAIFGMDEKIMYNLFQIDQFPNWLLWFVCISFFISLLCLSIEFVLPIGCVHLAMSNRE